MRIKSLLLLLAIVSAGFMSGCIHGGKPKTPAVISSTKTGFAYYTVEDFTTDYNAYKCLTGVPVNAAFQRNGNNQNCSQNLDQARILRDVIINRVRANIDKNYHDFESDIFLGRAKSNIFGDFLELGLDAAGAISGGARVKSIIAISNSTVKGTRTSIDKNLFAEKTTDIIISQMQAAREKLGIAIVESMAKSTVKEYPLERAFDDLVNYFYAGTLQSGLQELSQQAGKAASDAKADTQTRLERLRAGTKEEAKLAMTNTERFFQLRDAATKEPIDVERAAAAIKVARNAIKELSGKEAAADLKPSEVFKELQMAMGEAAKLPDGTARIRKALGLEP